MLGVCKYDGFTLVKAGFELLDWEVKSWGVGALWWSLRSGSLKSDFMVFCCHPVFSPQVFEKLQSLPMCLCCLPLIVCPVGLLCVHFHSSEQNKQHWEELDPTRAGPSPPTITLWVVRFFWQVLWPLSLTFCQRASRLQTSNKMAFQTERLIGRLEEIRECQRSLPPSTISHCNKQVNRNKHRKAWISMRFKKQSYLMSNKVHSHPATAYVSQSGTWLQVIIHFV